MKLCGVCVLTDNVPRLARFYEQVLCCPPEGDAVHVSFSAAQLAVWNPGDVTVSPHKTASLMFYVDDAEGEYRRLGALGLGIRFQSAPTSKPWGVRSFSFLDPDGNEVNFLEPLPRTSP